MSWSNRSRAGLIAPASESGAVMAPELFIPYAPLAGLLDRLTVTTGRLGNAGVSAWLSRRRAVDALKKYCDTSWARLLWAVSSVMRLLMAGARLETLLATPWTSS